jgi:hypothetical protein
MADDEKPLDPEAARAVTQVRRLMLIATATTFVAVAVVIGVIGNRVFKSGGSAPPLGNVTATLPAGAKIVSSAVGDGRIVLTVEIGGAIELRSFDLATLKPIAVMRFATQP